MNVGSRHGKGRGLHLHVALVVLVTICVFVEPVPAGAAAGDTVRLSVDTANHQANGDSEWPSLSTDGRTVAFESDASNLVEGDANGVPDIFVRGAFGFLIRVSVGLDGEGNARSGEPVVSGDGGAIAFSSDASNLVSDDTNGESDVFLRVLRTLSTVRVSISSNGGQANGPSFAPSVSGDGQIIAYSSFASNLVPNDTNGTADIFVYNRADGSTLRVSVGSAGAHGTGDSVSPAISRDGRFVAFQSSASNLSPGDTNGEVDVFVHDRDTARTEQVSLSDDGVQGTASSVGPAISDDGRYIAFESWAPELVPSDTNGRPDVFVRDRTSSTTTRVSVDSKGKQGNGHSQGRVAITGDGRTVLFESTASNLVKYDTNGASDVFTHDRIKGYTERRSVGSGGRQTTFQAPSWEGALSGNGRFIAFASIADNLVTGDTNDLNDIFRHETDVIAIGYTVVGLGDSVAAGYGLAGAPGGSRVAYPYLVAEELGRIPVTFAISGGDSDLVRKRLDAALRTDPEVVTLTVGANDVGFPDCIVATLKSLGGRSFHNPCEEGKGFASRIAKLERNLVAIFDEVAAKSPKSVVAVTLYYDPLQQPRACDLPAVVAGDERETIYHALDALSELSGRVTTALNGAINRAARNATNVQVVDLRQTFTAGHDMCAGADHQYVFGPKVKATLASVFNVDLFDGATCPYPPANDPNFSGKVNGLKVDGAANCMPHPTEEGQRRIAAAIVARIRPSS